MLNNITNKAIFRNIIALFSMLLVKNGYGAVSQILNDSFFQNPAELQVVNNTQAIIGNVFINPNVKFKGSSYGISGNANSNVFDYLPCLLSAYTGLVYESPKVVGSPKLATKPILIDDSSPLMLYL